MSMPPVNLVNLLEHDQLSQYTKDKIVAADAAIEKFNKLCMELPKQSVLTWEDLEKLTEAAMLIRMRFKEILQEMISHLTTTEKRPHLSQIEEISKRCFPVIHQLYETIDLVIEENMPQGKYEEVAKQLVADEAVYQQISQAKDQYMQNKNSDLPPAADAIRKWKAELSKLSIPVTGPAALNVDTAKTITLSDADKINLQQVEQALIAFKQSLQILHNIAYLPAQSAMDLVPSILKVSRQLMTIVASMSTLMQQAGSNTLQFQALDAQLQAMVIQNFIFLKTIEQALLKNEGKTQAARDVMRDSHARLNKMINQINKIGHYINALLGIRTPDQFEEFAPLMGSFKPDFTQGTSDIDQRAIFLAVNNLQIKITTKWPAFSYESDEKSATYAELHKIMPPVKKPPTPADSSVVKVPAKNETAASVTALKEPTSARVVRLPADPQVARRNSFS